MTMLSGTLICLTFISSTFAVPHYAAVGSTVELDYKGSRIRQVRLGFTHSQQMVHFMVLRIHQQELYLTAV
jgi:hypothetical protein